MEKIVQNLIKIASSLDNQKEIKLALKIDKFADSLLEIKTAQYVGVQGYWVRNERCWSNCYRQKRAKSPDTPTQVIWQECQNEYVESINNPTSGWEKYAEDDKQIKLSDSEQKIIKTEKDFFNKSITKKIESGMEPTVAVFDTIEERKAGYIKEQIKLANSMLQFAEKIDKEGFKKEAKSLAEEASEIIKEAGFFDNIWSGIKGEGKIYQQAQTIFANNIASLNSTLQAFKSNPNKYFPQRNVFTKEMQKTIRNLQGFINQAKGISSLTSRGVWELTTDFMQQAVPVATAISNSTDVGSFTQAIDNGIMVLNSFVQEVPEKIEEKAEQTELMEGQTEQPIQEQAVQEQSPGTETVTGIWRIMKDYVDNQPDKKRAISNLRGKLTLILKDIEKELSQTVNQDQTQQPYQATSGWQGVEQTAAKSYFSLVK